MQRIEAVRRILPFCFFNEETTEAGIACLGYTMRRKTSSGMLDLDRNTIFRATPPTPSA
jgi:hypothetical protein